MLTSGEITKITVDYMIGRPPRVTGPEADAFRERLKKDVEGIQARGHVVEIPAEWAVEGVDD